MSLKMKKSISITLQSILVIFISYSYCFAESSCGLVNRANSLYKQKKYDEAIKLYNEAQIKSPDSAEINYNIGIAQYKKEDYLSAVSFLEKATASRDEILESKANFNIGNAKYKLGKLKENTDLKETVELLRQSLDYYKRAIELDSKDEDARVNHELVEKELKMLLDKLKQEQDRKKEQSEQEKTKEEQDQSQEGAQEEKQGQQAALGQEQKTGEQKKEEAKTASEVKPTEEQKQAQTEESKAPAAEEIKEMSEKEADMLLEGYGQEENSAGKLEDRKKGFSGEVLKDW
ncbi:MAG: tetratricopeptide repeat protein [Candidatus Omnitrophica bacterium]|jgi:Ca-activated chloride channel family protein|nr:tetratricopeptide repeat protein [Candidatus Omnitrophota bacterium]